MRGWSHSCGTGTIALHILQVMGGPQEQEEDYLHKI
jgi:hypothetical protein